ncbi:MAG: hypothetical protein ABSE53_09920 [Terracidiphilus sp.]|jgi:hypothetical protein
MRSGFVGAGVRLVFGVAFLGLSCSLFAQEAGSAPPAADIVPSSAIPDASTPQIDLAAVDPQSGQTQSTQQPAVGSAPTPDSSASSPQNSASQSSSSAQQSGASQQSSAQPASGQETQQQKAAEQIKEQEQQRIVGVVPAFNTSYRWNAASMTAGQKMGLALRSMTDPFQFAAAFLVAGYHEALDDDPGFGWGPEGYFKRSGAAYLDAFDGDIIGNGILPILFHQDPRYFRMGHGTKTHRLLYALATNVICRHDNTGKWEPNYSNVGGNIIAGALSNLYYPKASRSGVGLTFSNGLVVTAEGGLGSIFEEFWPDISRKVLHRDPTHGLDAQQAAEDQEKKNGNSGSGTGNDSPNPK